MSVDVKNIVRSDLQDIYTECQNRSYRKCMAVGLDVDIFAISGNEIGQLHEFATEGATIIADKTDRVKYHNETGFDALTFYPDMESPEDAESYTDPDEETAGDETIEDPNGDTIKVDKIIGRTHESGEKMVRAGQDYIMFEIDELEEDHSRYTVVQQYLKSALINYILYKWWDLMAQGELAASEYRSFDTLLSGARFNSVSNNAQSNVRRPYNYYY